MFSAIRTRLTRRSLRARLTVWYVLTLGGALVGFAGFVLMMRTHSLYEALDGDVQLAAQRLASDLRPDLFSLDVASTLGGDPHATEAPICVRQMSGAIVFRSTSFPELTWNGEREAAAAVQHAGEVRAVRDRDGHALRLASVTVARPGAEWLVLQVAVSAAPIGSVLAQLAGLLAIGIVAVLGIAAWGSSSTVRRALAPVEAIVARVRHIQANRLNDRLDVRADSHELDRLVTTLNEMLDRVQGSVTSARRFAADASHELQTPIAAIRGTLDMCVRLGCSANDWRGFAVDLLEDLDRLSELVRDLRLLALADGGHLIDDMSPVPLATLVDDCCETASAIAADRQIHVESTVAEPVAVTGSERHLRRVVLNLLQNAIRYSRPDASVLLSVWRAGDEAVLMVSDSGCGIDAADLPHIFEPFYRADPARARDTGGTGLGLAIADQIVRAHGGRIEVTSTPGAGSTFAVYLPLARVHPAPEPPVGSMNVL